MPKTDDNVSSTTVAITGNKVEVSSPPLQTISYERLPYPHAFAEWQSNSRLEMFQKLAKASADSVHSQPAHLPVLATLGSGVFPINLASRGIGLLPKHELLEKYISLLVSAKNEASTRIWQESLTARVNAIGQLYRNPAEIDPMLLGGLEIFEGRTAENIRSNPLVSLLYSGEPPQFPSYQFNCIAEILPPDDMRYQFLLAARELFAFDSFHITQKHYPFGYAFHLVEIKEKTPHPRR